MHHRSGVFRGCDRRGKKIYNRLLSIKLISASREEEGVVFGCGYLFIYLFLRREEGGKRMGGACVVAHISVFHMKKRKRGTSLSMCYPSIIMISQVCSVMVSFRKYQEEKIRNIEKSKLNSGKPISWLWCLALGDHTYIYFLKSQKKNKIK